MYTNYCFLQDSNILEYDAVSHWLVFPDVSDDRKDSISNP